jgi:hypothetical protein
MLRSAVSLGVLVSINAGIWLYPVEMVETGETVDIKEMQ